ncbi:MAG: OmpA family protein, partial [Flavobacteriales bacterium]
TARTKRNDTLVAPPGTSPQGRNLQELEPDSVAPVLQDTVDNVRMDTARVGHFVRGARHHPQDSIVGGKAPVVVHDTVTVYKKQSESQGRVDTVYVDRPVPTKRSETATPTSTQQPQQVIIRQEASGSKDTRTVPLPIPIVIPNNQTKVVQDPALQDSLRRMEAENQRLRHLSDSLRGDTSALGVHRRSAVPVGTTPLPPGVRPDDYAFMLNDLLAARIATLERYIEVMDNKGSAAETDSLKQRIAAMDGELEKLRSKRKATKDGAATTPGPGQTLMDTISFSIGSSRVGSEERAHLLKMGKQIASGKIERVLVTGQTDRSGDPAFNLQLSQKRADAVKQVLVEAGVPVGIISAKGLGDKLAQHTHHESERVVVVQLVMPAKKAVE